MSENIYQKLKTSFLFFAELTIEEITEVMRTCTKKVYNKDECVFKEGTVGAEMYILLNGSVRLEQNDKKNQTVLKLFTGQHFGELGLLTKKPRTFSVFADEHKTTVLMLNEFNINKNYGLAYRFYKQIVLSLSMKIRELNEQYLEKKKGSERFRLMNEHHMRDFYHGKIEFDSLETTEMDFQGLKLEHASFKDSVFAYGKFQESELYDCDFSRADASLLETEHAHFKGGLFEKAYFQAANFENVVFKNCTFEKINFDAIDVRKVTIERSPERTEPTKDDHFPFFLKRPKKKSAKSPSEWS